MDRDTDLFIQAFWVKCHEIIRPEIDAAAKELASAGHDTGVSTQEYSASPDRLPMSVGPSLTLTLKPNGTTDGGTRPAIEFHGDVVRRMVEVRVSTGERHTYELAALDTPEVRNEIDDWLGRLITSSPD